MCGIAGFLTTQPSSHGTAVLERMTSAIQHRGPDEYGYFSANASVFLGHRRLSIVDLATGQQPMTNEDGQLHLVYNGEIFNHASLRPELERAGHIYKTRSDTEMILHAYEQYGPGCVEKFRGMYAFALWDAGARRLFCARDRLGKKPFYYFWDGRLFAFASEIKALLEHPEISPAVEEELLPEYLAFGYVSGERTLFRGIRQLPPGHTLLWAPDGQGPRIERYWDMPVPTGEESGGSDAEWIQRIRTGLEKSVEMRLMADVPLGMFLSGGVDSSAIAALIRRLTGGPLNTFSVGYAEEAYSELGYAAEVAQALGTTHHEVRLSRDEFFGSLPSLIWHEDEPISWPSSVSLYFVARLAAEKVKVVLTGEGSDELFAGYSRYGWTGKNLQWGAAYGRLPEFFRRWVRGQVADSPLLGADLRRKISHTVVGREASIESLHLDNFYCAFSREEQARLMPNLRGDIYGGFLRAWNQHPQASLLRRMLYADQKTYLIELLMKQDQMSMAASLESRVPFLDHEFATLAMTVPDRLKIQGREQKYILKRAVEDLLPSSIIYRTKMGFPTPLKQWLREPAAQPLFDSITDKQGFAAAYLDLGQVKQLIERHQAGREDATDRLWRLLNLGIWGDVFLTGRRRPAAAASLTATR
jgi:asparagine synthase (glutamine-hydrolysing)